MVVAGKRQRGSFLTLLVVGGLVVAFGAFVAYRYFTRPYFISDPVLMEELQDATLFKLQAEIGGQPVIFGPEPKIKLADWPQWRGPDRDGIARPTKFLTDWPAKGPSVLWTAEVGAGYSSLAVVDGRVYTMLRDDDKEVVLCLDAGSGKEKWRHSYPGKYDEHRFTEGYGAGPRSTPTVDGDFLYTVGATGIFHCLKTADGKVVWKKELLKEFKADNPRWGVSFSPLVDEGLVFTNPGGDNGKSLVAFDKKTGKLKWKSLDDPAGYSSPIVVTLAGTRQIVFFTGKGLVGVDPRTGKLFWRFPWETNYGCNIATPIAVGNYLFLSSGYGRGCAVVKVSKDKGGLFRASRVYEHNQMRNHFATSVFYQDHVYGFDESKLTCMNFRTGKILWKEGGFKKGTLLIAGGYLVVLGENGKLAVGYASPEGFKAKSSFQVSRRKCWTMPVLAEGKLFVRDENDIICLDVKKR